MRSVWILLAVFALGECRRSSSDENEVTTDCLNKDVDKYLDDVLEKARTELPDPMRLPPRSTIVELSDGSLWGMSELKRVGDAQVTCKDNTVTIKAKLTVDELKGRYTWTEKRRNSSPREGYVVFISDDFEADITLVIEKKEVEKKEGETTHPKLERFVIKKFQKAKVEMTGAGFITWALGEITTLMSGIFQRAIAHAIQDPIREALERQMREMTLEY